MPLVTRAPRDFPNPPRFAPAKAVDGVPVYVDTTEGRFCADVPSRGYLERASHADLARAIRGATTAFDAILYEDWRSWGLPAEPRKIRVIGYRRNPRYGGKWLFRTYHNTGTSAAPREELGTYQDTTESEVYPYSDELWDAVTAAYRALVAARDAHSRFVETLTDRAVARPARDKD